MSFPLLEVVNMSVHLSDHGGTQVPIVRNLSLRLDWGESLGIVGESGSGKSVTLQAIRRTLGEQFSVSGQVLFDRHDVYDMPPNALRSWHQTAVGMIYQDARAAMNPVRRIGDFITETLRTRMPKAEAARRASNQLREVGIRDPERRMDQYPHELSGGLLQRVMIASVLLDEPSVILADEPTTALDVTTQEEVMAILDGLRRERDMAFILVTHDLDLAAAVSDRVATFYAGQLVELGPARALHDTAVHPYTRALLDSRPALTEKAELRAIPGRPVSAFEVGVGCSFASRCPLRVDRCESMPPVLAEVAGRLVACHLTMESATASGIGDSHD